MSANALIKLENDTQKNELLQLVSFILADEEYGVEVLKVREIIFCNEANNHGLL